MVPCLQVGVVLLGENTCKCRLHVVNGATGHQLSYLIDMVLELDVAIGLVAVCAVNRVSEHISTEPFGVIEGDIESKLLLPILLPDSDMTQFLNFLSVEFFSRCDFCFIRQ